MMSCCNESPEEGGPAGEAAEMVLQGRREKGDRRRETVNGER